MSCSNAIYVANTASQTVAINSAVNLGSVLRRFGCGISGGGSGISISKCGYYLVTANVTFTAPTTGVVAMSLQDNGQQVAGATAAESVATATTEQHTISITAIVRSIAGADTLSIVNTGIACTPSNVAITVTKL